MKKLTSLNTPWEVKILAQKEFESLSLLARLTYLCHFGTLAPTTHNTVPQKYKLIPEKNEIEVWVDPQFILPASDKIGRQATISMGCVIENIVCAASSYGFSPRIAHHTIDANNLIPSKKNSKPHLLATLSLGSSQKSDFLQKKTLENILHRKTLRAEYDPKVTLTPSLSLKLHKHAADFNNLSLKLIENKLALNAISKIQEIADRTVIERDVFAYELGHWLIPNDDKKSLRGMRGYEFGFDDQFAHRVHSGLLRKTRLLPDETAAFASGGKIGIRSSSCLAIITAKKENIMSWVEAGQLFERIALTLIQNGFYTAMHAGITEVKIVSRMFATFLSTKEVPLVILRIGKPYMKNDILRPHSSRPPTKELILS